MKISKIIVEWVEYNITNYTLYNDNMLLYHGSIDEIKRPNILRSIVNGERGKGFYVYFSQKPATLNKYTTNGYVNTYMLDLTKLDKLLSHHVRVNEQGSILSIIDNIDNNAVLTLDIGKGFTKLAGGQLVFRKQNIIDECVQFHSSAFQKELLEIYTEHEKEFNIGENSFYQLFIKNMSHMKSNGNYVYGG